MKLLPTQPIGASLIVSEELFEEGTKTYYGPRTDYSKFEGYHAVLIVVVEEYNGEIVARCKMSNDTKVGNEGYVRVWLSTMYLFLGVDEEIQNFVKGNSEPVYISFLNLLHLNWTRMRTRKTMRKRIKNAKEMPEEKPEDKQYPHVSKKILFWACLTFFLKMVIHTCLIVLSSSKQIYLLCCLFLAVD